MNSLWRPILRTGMIAGVLDGAAAVVKYLVEGGQRPGVIFRFIASGVLGRSAFEEGEWVIFVGVVLHLAIATTWAGIYFFAASRTGVVRRQWVLMGLVYGIVVWTVMNLVVVPLSRTPPLPSSAGQVVIGIMIIIICVGLPIARAARKHFNDAVSTDQ